MGSVDARPNPRARPRIRPRQERESRFVRCVAARNDETAALLSTVAAATGSPDMMNRYSSADDINDASDIIVVPIRSNFFMASFLFYIVCADLFQPSFALTAAAADATETPWRLKSADGICSEGAEMHNVPMARPVLSNIGAAMQCKPSRPSALSMAYPCLRTFTRAFSNSLRDVIVWAVCRRNGSASIRRADSASGKNAKMLFQPAPVLRSVVHTPFSST